jgi:uncharacterized membrane protein (DUF2068 family)
VKITGTRLIVAYKLGKAALQLVLGVVLVSLSRTVTHELHVIVHALREHAVDAWSVALANRLVGFATRRHVVLVGVAALLDAAVSFVEGWALERNHWWGPWLVVVATGSLLPFEILALAHHFTLGHAIVLALNVTIVAYLVRQKTKPHRSQSRTAGPPSSETTQGLKPAEM